MKSKWEKFKHRTLTKVFLGYAVVAWVLIQVIEAVLPTFETPLWVAQTITFLLILGFPVAILVGWASEKLPAASTDSEQQTTPQLAHATPRRTLVLIGVGACVVVGLFGFYMMPFIFDESSFNQGRNLAGSSGLVQTTPTFVSLRHKVNVFQPARRGWGSKTDITISPNGESLVYSEYSPPTLEIKLLDLKSFDEPRSMASMQMNQNTGYPVFSEDGQWIYYHVDAGITRVRLEGGTPQVVLDTGAASSGVAVRGQEVVFSSVPDHELLILNISTGTTRSLLDPEQIENTEYTWPQFVPGQNKLVVTRGSRGSYADAGIDIIDLDTGEIHELINIGFKGRFVLSGHIVFARGESLWAQPVSPDLAQTTGEAIPVLFDSEIYVPYGNVGFSVSESGRLVYVNGSLTDLDRVNTDVSLVNKTGQEVIKVDVEDGNYAWAQFSPDGEYISLTSFGPSSGNDLWVYDLDSTIIGRRTFDDVSSRSIWSEDSTKLFYRCNQSICSTLSNGTESPKQIVSGLVSPQPLAETLDGELIVSLRDTDKGAYLLNLNEDEVEESIFVDLELSNAIHGDVSLSGNNEWIAYYSEETGRGEIYIRPFPDISSGKWQVSRDGGRWPLWNDETNELYFWAINNNTAMSVQFSISQDQSGRNLINLNNPELMFETSRFRFSPSGRPWDYDPKLERFVLVDNPINTERSSGAIDEIQLHVIEDWFGELSSLAPSTYLQ